MSNNASTINTQQVSTDNSNSATKVQSPQVAFPPITPFKDSPAVVDTAVFTGMSSTGPIQVRDGTPHLSFVPIRGAFIDADTIASLQSQPAAYLAAIKDGKDNALSPLSLSPVPPHSEKSASPSLLPIPPRPQADNHSGASSTDCHRQYWDPAEACNDCCKVLLWHRNVNSISFAEGALP